jgi:hypothetical protein
VSKVSSKSDASTLEKGIGRLTRSGLATRFWAERSRQVEGLTEAKAPQTVQNVELYVSGWSVRAQPDCPAYNAQQSETLIPQISMTT